MFSERSMNVMQPIGLQHIIDEKLARNLSGDWAFLSHFNQSKDHPLYRLYPNTLPICNHLTGEVESAVVFFN